MFDLTPILFFFSLPESSAVRQDFSFPTGDEAHVPYSGSSGISSIRQGQGPVSDPWTTNFPMSLLNIKRPELEMGFLGHQPTIWVCWLSEYSPLPCPYSLSLSLLACHAVDSTSRLSNI